MSSWVFQTPAFLIWRQKKVVQTVSICRPKHMRMFRLLYIYTLILILKVGFTARTNSLRQLGLTWNKIRSSNGIWTPVGCQRISKHPWLSMGSCEFKILKVCNPGLRTWVVSEKKNGPIFVPARSACTKKFNESRPIFYIIQPKKPMPE
jgi:hypothetical protein